MKKTILFLGGAYSQVPVIRYAKEQGYRVITVDYLPDNPGHIYADEYYNVSTINKEEVLKVARQLKVDAVSAYASDPSAPTAAYICDNLQLQGSSYLSVSTLSDKSLFREFLRKNGFKFPWFCYGNLVEDLLENYVGGKAIIKPVDSSGSKGIALVDNERDIKSKFDEARQHSKTGLVIMEQFIERKGPQIHGEGFVLNGEVVFLYLGDQYFSPTNNLVPYSTIIPSVEHQDIMENIHKTVKDVIAKVGFTTGGINVEVIRDINDDIYVLEIGARNGGNFMPQLMKHATGFDLVKANVDSLFKKEVVFDDLGYKKEHYAQLILHSSEDGKFGGVKIPALLQDWIIEKNLYYKEGEQVYRYRNSRDVIGVLICSLNKNNLDFYIETLKSHSWIGIYE